MNTIVVTKKNFGEAIAQMYEYICAKPKASLTVVQSSPSGESLQEFIMAKKHLETSEWSAVVDNKVDLKKHLATLKH